MPSPTSGPQVYVFFAFDPWTLLDAEGPRAPSLHSVNTSCPFRADPHSQQLLESHRVRNQAPEDQGQLTEGAGTSSTFRHLGRRRNARRWGYPSSENEEHTTRQAPRGLLFQEAFLGSWYSCIPLDPRSPSHCRSVPGWVRC